MVQTCRGLGINPREYLEDVMRRIMGHNSQKLHELLPVQWLKSRHSPRIAKIEVMKEGIVRRSKLYYLRGTSGKASKVKGRLGGGRSVARVDEAPAEVENEEATASQPE